MQYIIGIGLVAVIFPKLFGFIMSILKFFWNIIGTVVMFFVGLLNGVTSAIPSDTLAEGVGMIGKLTEPFENLMSGSIIAPAILLIILGILFLILISSDLEAVISNSDFVLKLNYAWFFSAMNLGLIAAGSGHPYRSLCGVIGDFFMKFPISLSNFPEWGAFTKLMLIFVVFGGLFSSIMMSRSISNRAFFSTWTAYAFSGMLGFLGMRARLFIFHWLGENVGFIGKISNIPIGFLETILFIQFFFGVVVLLMPSGMIASINKANTERARHSISSPSKSAAVDDDDDDGFGYTPPKSVFPEYLMIGGEQYRLNHDSGDHAEYYCPKTGARKTVWETELTTD